MPGVVQTAVLFLEADSAAGDGAAAFLPVGGVPLVTRLARRLAAADIRQIIFLAPADWPALRKLIVELQSEGLSAIWVAKITELADYVRADQPLLLVQDGVLPSPALIERVTEQAESAIYTRPAPSSDERHERIDLSDRWAGVAVLPGRVVHALDALPDGWSPASALLRRAVQEGLARVPLEIAPESRERADMLVNAADAALAEQRMAEQHFGRDSDGDGPFDHWFARPISRRIMPRLWKGHYGAGRIAQSLLVGALATFLLAMAGLVLPAIFAALAVLVGCRVQHDYLSLSGAEGISRRGVTPRVTGLLLALAAPAAAVAEHGVTLAAISAGALLPLTLLAADVKAADGGGKARLMDAGMALLIVGVGYAFGAALLPMLLLAGVLILAASLMPRSAMGGLKPI